MIKPLCVIATLFLTVTQVIALPVSDIENIQDSPAAGDNDVPEAAVDLIKEFEGLYLNAYNDPKTGGKPITIGWGSTKTLKGGEWKLGESITKAQAEVLLKHEILTRTLPGCKKIPTWTQMNDNQKGAIISFAYNLGENFYSTTKDAFKTISTALSKTENWKNVPAALLLYVNPGSNVEKGLRRRRQAEAAVWNSKTGAADDQEDALGITGDAGEICKNGQDGICGTPSSCKTKTVPGHCNGGPDNVCCLNAATPPPTPEPPTPAPKGVVGDAGEPCKNGQLGVCGNPTSCKTKTVPGHCNGLNDNICCLNAPGPAPTTPSTPSTGPAGDSGQACKLGMPGVCSSSCHGVTVSGFCNGAWTCCLPSTQSLWKSAFEHPNIKYNDFHFSKVIDEATAYKEARDAAAGKASWLSAYGNCPKPQGKTRLIPELAATLLKIAKLGTVVLNEIAGGSHSVGSRHYDGIGMDIGSLNGKGFTYGVPEALQVIKICREFGATEILNINIPCGDSCKKHNGWIHCAWPRAREGKV